MPSSINNRGMCKQLFFTFFILSVAPCLYLRELVAINCRIAVLFNNQFGCCYIILCFEISRLDELS